MTSITHTTIVLRRNDATLRSNSRSQPQRTQPSLRPDRTTHPVLVESPRNLQSLDDSPNIFGVTPPVPRPLVYTSADLPRQIDRKAAREIKPLRLALVQTSVSLTDEFLDHLLQSGIAPFIAAPERILHRLNSSPEEWDIIGYPVASQSQRALEFARELRRVRERGGATPYPWALIISFQEQFSATVEWFRRVGGTRYWRFTSKNDFTQVLREMQRGILAALRGLHKLHLRLVHGGNRFGVGCVEEEALEAVYVSFHPGMEDELEESESILRFANLMGMYRWRARTAAQLIGLMQKSPFYSHQALSSNILGRSSIKTYVMRFEKALLKIWIKQNGDELPPPFVRHESRGGREVAYRLLGTAEIDHI